MKLGLKIEITSQGAGSAAKTLNSTPALEKYASASRSFIKEVFPAREDLRQKGIDPNLSLDESERSVLFLRFLGPDGFLICIFQARPENSGRPYDGAAAWILVPASVLLTGDETLQLIDDVESAMSEARGINYNRLETIFAMDYKTRNILPAISTIGSNGTTCGIRYYGSGTDYQLKEYLGKAIAQQIYSKYKAIFLLRKSDSLAVAAPAITTPLSHTCIMSAPMSVVGYKPYFENGKPFNVDLEYPANAQLTIIWKKDGFQDIPKTAKAQDGDSEATKNLFIMNRNEIKVAIHKNIFNIYGHGTLLDKFQIVIDGQILNDVVFIQQDKLAQGVNVRVSSDGYKTFSKDTIIAYDTKRIDIKLNRETYVYEFSMPMYRDGERIDDGLISVETHHKIHKCPIEGYSLMNENIREGEGNYNRIEFAGIKQAIKHFAYGFLSCFLIFCLIGLYEVVEDIKDVKFQLGWPPIEFIMESDQPQRNVTYAKEYSEPKETAPKDSSLNDSIKLSKAINELNQNSSWNFQTLKKYDCLDGLFEDLNNYNFTALTSVWKDKLKDVDSFAEILKAVEKAQEGGWNLQQGKHPYTTYNAPKDSIINVKNYINWIEKDQTPKPMSKPNHIKPANSKSKKSTNESTKAKKNSKGRPSIPNK